MMDHDPKEARGSFGTRIMMKKSPMPKMLKNIFKMVG
jgi:hypothetical protein